LNPLARERLLITFGQEHQGFQGLMPWGTLPKKERLGSFRECLAAGLALIALDAFLRMAGFDYVLLCLTAL
jgi:hypothetical protein